MLDSLLTTTKAGALWMLAALVVSVLLDRGLSAILGRQEPIFLLFALASAAALVVRGTYTLAKLAVRRVRGRGDS